MSDLIDRQAAIDALARTAREKFNLSDEFSHYLAGLMDGELAIRRLPSAQPERKTGKWLETDSHEPCWYKCDQCGRLHDFLDNYCPACGADMRGGNER